MELVRKHGVVNREQYKVLGLFDGCTVDWNKEADKLIEIAKANPSSWYFVSGDKSLLQINSFLKLFKGTMNIYCLSRTFNGVRFDELFELAYNFSNTGCIRLAEAARGAICDALERVMPKSHSISVSFYDQNFIDDKLILEAIGYKKGAIIYRKREATAIVGRRSQFDKMDILLDVNTESAKIVGQTSDDFYSTVFNTLDIGDPKDFYIGF